MAYPPSPSRSLTHAESYELSDQVAGPSRRRASKSRPVRTLTLHANDTAANLLFAAPSNGFPPLQRHSSVETPKRLHRRTISLSGSPVLSPHRGPWANFLNEDPHPHAGHEHDPPDTQSGPARMEQVHVPDFGHMLGFNPEDEDHYAVARGITAEWRKRLYLLMEEPRSGREAFFVHIFVTGAILFSVVLTTLSTLPTFHLHPTSIQLLFGLDTTLVVLFTFEYLARSVAHADNWTQYWTWATSFFPILDLLAILPYYIEVAREEDTSILFRFTILRTFRLLRVFRAFKYQNTMLLTIEVMYVAVQRSKDALAAISFFILLVLVLFSTLIYFAERGTWDATVGAFLDADGDPSLFDSIPQTAWFALVTMSTVGYGDVVPRSILGKLLTMPLLLFGLLLIALPSFVLGRNFAIVFDAMNTQLAQKPLSPPLRRSFETPLSPMLPLPPSVTTSSPTPRTAHSARMPDADTSVDLEAALTDAAPLLPSASVEPISALPPYAPSAGGKVLVQMVASGSNASVFSARLGLGNGLRMYEPAEDGGMLSAAPSSDGRRDRERNLEREREKSDNRDLTNVKLARNQLASHALVLLEEIGSLRRAMERQGELIARLLQLAESQTGHEKPETGTSAHSTVSPAASLRQRPDGTDHEEQFAIGSDDGKGP